MSKIKIKIICMVDLSSYDYTVITGSLDSSWEEVEPSQLPEIYAMVHKLNQIEQPYIPFTDKHKFVYKLLIDDCIPVNKRLEDYREILKKEDEERKQKEEETKRIKAEKLEKKAERAAARKLKQEEEERAHFEALKNKYEKA